MTGLRVNGVEMNTVPHDMFTCVVFFFRKCLRVMNVEAHAAHYQMASTIIILSDDKRRGNNIYRIRVMHRLAPLPHGGTIIDI